MVTYPFLTPEKVTYCTQRDLAAYPASISQPHTMSFQSIPPHNGRLSSHEIKLASKGEMSIQLKDSIYNFSESTNVIYPTDGSSQYCQEKTPSKETFDTQINQNIFPVPKQDDGQPNMEEGISSKDKQLTATLKWLSENYELAEGVCLPRCVLYLHYLDFCKKQDFKPAGAATFGKLIRQKFKSITTRRLGTRGQSKYHYYGIGILESSVYYQSVYTGKGLTRFSSIKIKTENSNRKYSLSSKTGTLLPEFPNAHKFKLPSSDITEKMNTLLIMYRTHSQRILDSVITANFEEIQNLLVHFWQGFPEHLQSLLSYPVTCHVIAICDSILYSVLIDVLIPNTIQDMPENLLIDLRAFLKSLRHWLQNSFHIDTPEDIKQTKYQILQQFLRSMARQLAFIKMAQICRCQLSNIELTYKALCDLDQIDFDQICILSNFTVQDTSVVNNQLACRMFEELKSILQKQSQIESYTDWIDSLIDKCVLKGSEQNALEMFQQRASNFLLQWTLFGSLLMKELTLNNCQTFAFLHLLKLTLDEYVLLVIETQTDKHADNLLHKNLQKFMNNADEIQMQASVRPQRHNYQETVKSKKSVNEDRQSPDKTTEKHCENFERQLFTSELTNGNTLKPTKVNKEITHKDKTSTSPSNLKCTSLNSSSLPSIEHFQSSDHNPYIHALTYTDFINHAPHGSFQSLHDLSTPQTFHTRTLNSVVNTSSQASYWVGSSINHSDLGDPYSLSYGNYPYSYNTLIRETMYQDSFGRANNTQDCSMLDNFSRTNYLLENLTRPTLCLDTTRPTVYYKGQTENKQVKSFVPMEAHNNRQMDVTGSQYLQSESFYYQGDVEAPLPHLSKSYLQANVRR
ncbi:DNA-binding protein RFX6-like isoform X1 [Biomphalaria glabrata]|uniref:DNA-binding protein RFX6 n=2 Tax=Biomphalaria glabrata TaxID=6526 RepID=A0A9U8E918_BIOGL|nr:DNA-binding protein RFX6-like isoform X1 [Biomphalaria glabrata]KAI8784179.1 DNA-binding protein RFX6 isoform X1 [Biomphalaria glabrata]